MAPSQSIFNVPIVLLIFNRPDTTEQVFQTIRQVQPSKLLVVADAPRKGHPTDQERCQLARAITEQVDWNCEVLRDYADTNLGCQQRVASGLDWVFDQVDEAIILEDDCVPHPSFFRFCQELLERYRDDKRVMSISGDNFQFGTHKISESYYFSRYPHCWGWATWKRAWQYNNTQVQFWEEVIKRNLLASILQNPNQEKFWSSRFQSAYEGTLDSWNACWTLACWVQSGLTILPQHNLVSNIGFGEAATNTSKSRSLARMPIAEMLFPLIHPEFVIRDSRADAFTETLIFSGGTLPTKLLAKAKQILGKT